MEEALLVTLLWQQTREYTLALMGLGYWLQDGGIGHPSKTTGRLLAIKRTNVEAKAE
ncbi:hypothetical protein ACN22W_33735 [Burkholderia theae]|uniref:hypothetical protein n=1 Tax=Burkholderia theae TaxID=3143496 RepID=UPI003AFB094E